jgi:putative transcriptional regulator
MKSLKGYLLVATEQLLDGNFVRTVLLLFDHNSEGAAGVVLNRPTQATITDVSERIFEEPIEWDKEIHLGGPVPGPLMALHNESDLADQEIIPGVSSTTDSTKLREIIERKPEPCFFLAQYAGWGAGQLEREIAEESWVYLPATVDHVFWTREQNLWDAVMKEIRASNLASMVKLKDIPADPSVN